MLGRPKTTGKTPLRSLRVPDREWEAWRAQAAKLGLSVSQWLRQLAAEAVDSAPKPD